MPMKDRISADFINNPLISSYMIRLYLCGAIKIDKRAGNPVINDDETDGVLVLSL